MAEIKRAPLQKVMTAVGTFVWPKLNKPDQFKPNDPLKYSVKQRLSAEDSEALIAKIEAALKAYWPTAQAELQKKIDEAKSGPDKAKAKKALAEMKEADKPYKPAYDDEGNETGEYEFNFKMNASFKGKDGKEKHIRPDIFDAAGKPMKVVPEIWGGTRGIVAGELNPFSMPIGVGIGLRLKAVQIIELRQGGEGQRDAAAYGFGKQEGYEAEDEPSMDDHAPADGESEAGGDEEF